MSQPLNEREYYLLQQLQARAVAAGQNPGQVGLPGPNMRATLNPPSDDQRLAGGVPYRMTRLGEPLAWLPYSPTIAWRNNDRVAAFTNQTANAQATVRLNFDTPSVIYKIAAGVRDTQGNAINGSFGTVLDTFQIQFTLSQAGIVFQTTATYGSTICGTAALPRVLDIPWRMDQGAAILVNVTPLMANLDVNIVLYTVETPGATNITSMP